jgi:glycosyltransferase involved in cell wall biosynthesis
MENVKGLVVLANKDDAEGLRRALDTLVRQKGCEVCKCFDILVIDGGSRDASDEVVESYSRKYGCINFKVQDVKGGVGPARIEAIRYALDRGYKYVVWGDSGNEYSEEYMKELVEV